MGQASAAEKSVGAGLKSLFMQNGLGAVCADVCRRLGVECLDDLKLVTAQDLSDESEEIPTEKFVRLFKTEVAGDTASCVANGIGTIECVVLNACNTVVLGKQLRDAGVPHVVCWRSEVHDSTASMFTSHFYASYEENKDLKLSFLPAANRIGSGRAEASLHKKHLHPCAVDYVCLLSKDGNEF